MSKMHVGVPGLGVMAKNLALSEIRSLARIQKLFSAPEGLHTKAERRSDLVRTLRNL